MANKRRQIYVESIKNSQTKMNKLQEKINNPHSKCSDIYEYTKDIKNAISRSNFFGNEMYISMGPLLDVVLYGQKEIITIQLTTNEYMCSYIENMAFMFHLIIDSLLSHPEDVEICSIVILKASKYYARALMAIVKLANSNNITLPEKLTKLEDQAKSLSKMRGSTLRGSTMLLTSVLLTSHGMDKDCNILKLLDILFEEFRQTLNLTYNKNYLYANQRNISFIGRLFGL